MRQAIDRVVTRQSGDISATALQAERSAYARNADTAKELAPKTLPPGVETAEAAAWTGVARVLLNLDEVITRE